MALTQVSTGGIKDGQVHTADLADAQITAGKLHADALDHTYTLGASGSDHYTFTGEGLTGAVNDPTLYLTRGKTYRFVNGNSSGAHPFRIQSVAGAGGTEYNTGVTNNAGAGGSTIIFEVPHDAPDVLYYICTSHAAMNGIFYVTGALADGTVTTAKLADDAVTGAKIADNAVVTAQVADDAITNAKIGANAVGTGEIADDAVTNAKIATNAITTGEITDQTVTLAKLEHGTSSNDGKFLRANNGADPSFETVSIPAGTTINNNADNRVITGSGTTNTLNGESSVVIDANGKLGVGIASPTAHLHVYKASHYVPTDSGRATGGIHVRGANGNDGEMGGAISFSCGDEASSAAIAARQFSQDASVTGLSIYTHPSTTGSDDAEEKVRIHADGRIQPKYSSSAGSTGGIMTVGAFNAKLNGHTGEGILQAVTNAGHAHTFDAAGWYDNSNYRHVPQVRGYYFYQVTMMFFTGMSGHAVEQSFQIRLNGTTIHGFTDGYNSNYGNYSKHSFHGIIKCDGSSDYVDVHCSSSRSVQIHAASAWTGYLLYPDS